MDEFVTRRDFLKVGTVALSAAAAAEVLAQDAPALRCAFIGIGGRGSGLLRSVVGFKDVEVVAVCDTSPENRKRAADTVEKAGRKRPEELGDGPYQYRDLLQRADLDSVVIATPCYWHTRMYLDCLAAEKPFYGEKPIAITAQEVKLLQAARRQHPNVVAQIGCQWGAHQGRADIIKQVQAGAIGDLIEGRFYRYNGWGSLGRWLNDRTLSGDWMLEQAVHEFNLLWWVIGQHPEAAYTVGRSGILEPNNKARNVTDWYTTILEYPKGLVVHYTHGWIDPPGFGGMSTRFIGTKGGLDVMACQIRQPNKEPIVGAGPGGDTPEHLRNFFDCVRAKQPGQVFCGMENGFASSYVGLLIRKSLDEKRRVTFAEMVDDPTPLPPLPPE